MKTVVIALGGNAILRPNQAATYANQFANVQRSAELIVGMVKSGYRVVVTHGNGPQVGNILRQNEEAKEIVPAMPLDVCSAQSQGFIGYMMEQSLKNALIELGILQPVVTLLTQTQVAQDDPAFQIPTKPIGLFYTQAEAQQLATEKGWKMEEDAGRGYRRVVPSPMPIDIEGIDIIQQLLARNALVIAGGGGGIAVVKDAQGKMRGVEAVIDKDRSAKKLAEQLQADVFMMLTDVSNVYIHFGTPQQKRLDRISADEAQAYLEQGQFGAGSMGPKMEAAIDFARLGKESIICSLDEAVLALQGQAGTRIYHK